MDLCTRIDLLSGIVADPRPGQEGLPGLGFGILGLRIQGSRV